MADFPKVTTSTRLWSQEVAAAQASQQLDSIGPVSEGVARLMVDKAEGGYEFTRRKFKEGRGFYQ